MRGVLFLVYVYMVSHVNSLFNLYPCIFVGLGNLIILFVDIKYSFASAVLSYMAVVDGLHEVLSAYETITLNF